ncbi:DEAD-box ATP-dependent RNA helicase 31-like [Musa acuminata AAA Group]|uniref:DEAD-box ATP-dependent RNA helicase 31-like n=1 Tax=Musa acuminata AAA Group TaxID=214697 RepID=UPI0031CE26FD
MVSRILALRLLRAAGAIRPSRSFVGSAAALFRLEYPSYVSSDPAMDDSVGYRSFSSRPVRPKAGVGSRGHRGGDFKSRGAVGQAKSLVEDEAELNDWISGLRNDSFRLGLSSDNEDSVADRSMGDKGRGRDGYSNRFRSRSGKGDSFRSTKDKAPSRRQWDDDFDDFSRASNRGRSRSSRNAPAKKQFESDLEDDEEDDDEEVAFSSKNRRGHRSQQTMPSTFSRRGGRDSESKFKKTIGGRRSVILESEGEKVEEIEDDHDLSASDDDIFSDEDEKEVSAKDILTNFGSPKQEQGDDGQPLPKKSTEGDNSYLSQTRFDECSISPLTLRGVKAAGYERMTQVQEATLPLILKGKDVLAKAKTGTGKTVAFLLPAIEVVSKLPPVERDQRRPPINVLVVCPTRELADQAAAEANQLLKYHPSIGVQVVMGGTRLALEQKRMQTNPCQILVATPGRLRDHIENTPGFATRLMGVKVLVLDEADRLLDMGFRKDIEKIVAAVPKQRQTLLFSATVPDEVRQICYIAMKRDLEFVNTVGEGTEETHSQVKQMHLVAPLEKQFSILYNILTEHISGNVDYKVIVFCTTAMATKLVADLLSELKLNVREIHSRKPQSYRTRVSKEFKESKGLILVSSDVSARGVDYPNVTLVIQLGVPADREQYIHRLGRTGRKGQEGTGILMLAPWEDFFLSTIKDLPITKASLPTVDLDTTKKVERALGHVELKNKESAYQAWLGYYNSNKNIGRDKYQLVALANEFSRSMGLDNPPAVPKLVLRKMGLNNVPGLRAK